MKFKQLLLLIPIFTLCACGAKNLTQEETLKRANDILNAQESITEIPTKFTYTTQVYSREETSLGVSESNVTTKKVIADLYFHTSITYENQNDEVRHISEYIYVLDQHLIALQVTSFNGETNGAYIKIRVGDETYSKIEEVLELAGDIYTDLSSKLPELEDILASDILEKIEDSYLSEEEIGDFGYSTYSFNAKSNGEGHLIIESAATISTSTTLSVYETMYEWTNNVISKITLESEKTTPVLTKTGSMSTTFSYTGKTTYPDLSKYIDVTPQMS